ncbi:MAG: GTP-binding protein [Bacteroidales bacterium]|nr:GTP-binding protein [Bacteroidales bacterium]
MIKKKICMIGAFAVGKTSLIQRYVNSIFSDKYHTTIGVKIDQKTMLVDQTEVQLLLWDIHGEDDYQKIKPAYLMGASGYFIVLDGTRSNTLEVAKVLQQMAADTIGDKPFIVLINKLDLIDEWEISEDTIQEMERKGWEIIRTSAKEDFGVEDAFVKITRKMMSA